MFRSHYRLTLAGTIGTAASIPERFSFGVCLAKGNGAGDSDGEGSADGTTQPNEGQFDDISDASVAFFGRPETYIGAHCRLTEVKLAWIGADGKYMRDPFIRGVDQAGGAGGTNPVHPAQVALAVSLGTDRRGPTGKGRFYLPGIVPLTQGSDMLIPQTNRDEIRGSCVQWLNDLNNEPGIDVLGLAVVVASTKGVNSEVRTVRVGRALDTIRSRRRSLPETYGDPVAIAND